MYSIAPSKRRLEALALPVIVLTSMALAFGTLHAGRRLVQDAGARVVRAALVRESDQVASQSLAELDARSGCRASRTWPLPFQTCVGAASLPGDSMRVSVRIEPRNRLVHPDSVLFTVVRAPR